MQANQSFRHKRHTAEKLILGAIAALIVLAAGGIFKTAQAQEPGDLRLVVHQLSYHFDRTQHFREVNPGLALQVRPASSAFSPPWSGGYVQAGAYKNSVDRNTAYAVAGAEPLALGPVRLGAALGVASGYRMRADQIVTERTVSDCAGQRKSGQCIPTTRIERTVTEQRVPRGGPVPMAALTASVQTGRVGLHLAITPTIKLDGATKAYGAAALLMSVRI